MVKTSDQGSSSSDTWSDEGSCCRSWMASRNIWSRAGRPRGHIPRCIVHSSWCALFSSITRCRLDTLCVTVASSGCGAGWSGRADRTVMGAAGHDSW